MNSKWRGEVGEGGEGWQWQQEERKEKNINCTARQTPKKLLTNERIRGGRWGSGEAEQRERAKRMGRTRNRQLETLKPLLHEAKRKEWMRGREGGTHYLMTDGTREGGERGRGRGRGGNGERLIFQLLLPGDFMSPSALRHPCALWKH